ncbi:unnamed protein product [Cochlearia groenlandica]
MEFWGVEVKAGSPVTVKPDEDILIHISQASLESKGKKGESVLLSVTVDGKKLVIGTLSQGTIPQISYDLVFEKEFELSHNLEKGSVHFTGYKSPNVELYPFFYKKTLLSLYLKCFFFLLCLSGKAAPAVSNVAKAAPKATAKPAEVKPASDDDEDDSDSDEEGDSEDDGSDSEKGMDVDSDDDDDSEDEEEDTPQKPEPINKKRANESASKTPVSAKKAKPAVAAPAAPAATPQKTEKKKGGHAATPHPAKKGGKSPVNANQSPKSGGQSSNGSNKKPFNSGKQFGSNNKGKGKGKGRA